MNRVRIAIAEDYAIIRKSLVTVLSLDRQLEVVAEAPNGAELLQSIKGLEPPPDVILLDINMPKMDGYETILAVKKDYPQMRFVVLSQFSHSIVVARMLIAGANSFLHKNCEPAELKRAIRVVMEQPYFQSELVKAELINLIQEGKSGKVPQLTPRETEFLQYCCTDLQYKEIASRMNISTRTTAFYRDELFAKLNVTTRTGLAIFALSIGISAAN